MSLAALIVLIVVIALLVYVAQQLPYPWQWVCYLIAALVLIVVLLRVAGLDLPVH
jgi:hypothetical protein